MHDCIPPLPADTRQEALLAWLQNDLSHSVEALVPASSDASFRRYFRARIDGSCFIAMDAPPPRENVRPFLRVGALLRQAGVQTPEVHAADPEQGFVLLEDFGTAAYLDELNDATADRLYGDALAALVRVQSAAASENGPLPRYDERLLRTELGIFTEWFLEGLLQIVLEPEEERAFADVTARLIESALEQPQVCVHRDYHSRNLMVTATGNPGVLDFQDAVMGPVTYDLVSLLRDCYVAWPDARVSGWMNDFRASLPQSGGLGAADDGVFQRWFDWMGMQRHLKAIGIFSRLQLRDGKPGYLKDIPRTLGYVMQVAEAYPAFSGFRCFLKDKVQPRLAEAGIPCAP